MVSGRRAVSPCVIRMVFEFLGDSLALVLLDFELRQALRKLAPTGDVVEGHEGCSVRTTRGRAGRCSPAPCKSACEIIGAGGTLTRTRN